MHGPVRYPEALARAFITTHGGVLAMIDLSYNAESALLSKRAAAYV